MTRIHTLRSAVALLLTTALLAALGTSAALAGGGGWGGSTAYPKKHSSSSKTGVAVKTAHSSKGTILVSSSGRTLYLFTADRKGKDVCVSQSGCAQAWPPYTVSGKPKAGAGVKAKMLGTIKLANHKLQVTYDGHPLYLYAGDSTAAATSYIGASSFGGTWYGVSPQGKAVK